MSFGFGSGFGQNNNANNNQQSTGTGFGGFGSSSNTNTGGFGASNTGGFGSSSTNTGGGLFGNSSTGGTGFGGFGSNAANTTNQASGFGATPASTGGSLFGGSTSTANNASGFGGFGSSTAQTASPFGASNTNSNTGGGLFGASKSGFGSGNTGSTTGSNLFGNTATSTGTGFGASGGAFGAGASTALGAGNVQCEGTGTTAFQPFIEKDGGTSQTNHFQTISFMQPYQRFSLEELRLADYAQGRRYGNANNQAGAFGTSTGFGGFGNAASSGSTFGQNNNTTSTGGGGLFGNSGSTSTGFGNTQSNTTPFGGSTASGGLFGAAKPAGNSLFGAASTTTPATQGGSLFGATNTTTGFGSNNAAGSSLFGNTSNNNAAKPGGFSFGGAAATNTTGGFGASNTAASSGGGLFGNTTATASPFGAANQQQNNANPFGLAQNQPANNSPFGNVNQNNQAKPAGGLFGNTTTNTGGGLFGSTGNNQQAQTGGLFGNNTNATNNNNATGGLFGAKPFGQTNTTNNTSGGLFGNTTNNNTTGTGGLFGGLGSNTQNQTQQNQAGGLFGAAAQQQAKPAGGLFGSLGQNTNNNANNAAGSSLFGNSAGNVNNTNAQQPGGGLFSLSNNNQNQQSVGTGSVGGSSLFGNNSTNQQVNQQPQGFSASIQDKDPYGSASLFSGLATPTAENSGPIATPLSSARKTRSNGLLPNYKMNPASSSRLITPQKRGYGFDYSTYGGTPGSVSSISSSAASTPMGLGSSFLGGSVGGSLQRTLAKSQSTSSLRRTFDSAESVLSPGAFSSANGRRFGGTTSLKKLQINRNLRQDLFSPPAQIAGSLPAPERNINDHTPIRGSNLKKRVSFEAGTVGGNGEGATNGSTHGSANIFSQVSSNNAEELATARPAPSPVRQTNGNTAPFRNIGEPAPTPEMEQVKGNELAIVHEDGTPPPANAATARVPDLAPSHNDEAMGKYWIKPPMQALKDMSRDQLKSLSGVIIGREGCGKVEFQYPVDLTGVDLDHFFGKLVVIETRKVTVYPEDVDKPLRGKGMNVPSIIRLHNSWPRRRAGRKHVHAKSGPDFDKHVLRLKQVKETEFLGYDADTGVWSFKVPHFTTYGLDYDDDDEETQLDASLLPTVPDTPTPPTKAPAAVALPSSQQSHGGLHDQSVLSDGGARQSSSSLDDTFQFTRSKNNLPGAFDGEEIFEDEFAMDTEAERRADDDQSFLDERSVGPASDGETDEPEEGRPDVPMTHEDGSVQDEDQEMAGSYPPLDLPTELRGGGELVRADDTSVATRPHATPKSILKGRPAWAQPEPGTPPRPTLDLDGDWMELLRRTVSPKKQDRAALRESQGVILKEKFDDLVTPPAKHASTRRGINTSIDLMNSLFSQDQHLKWPYAKRAKTSGLDLGSMDGTERSYHESNKPSWASDGTLVYALPSMSATGSDRSDHTSGIFTESRKPFVGEGNDVHFAKLAKSRNPVPDTLTLQKDFTRFQLQDGVPRARLQEQIFQFKSFPDLITAQDPQSLHEKLVWELASVLFDGVDLAREFSKGGISRDQEPYVEARIRKERLSAFWSHLVQGAAARQVQKASSNEERAIAHLSAHQIEDACGSLLHGRDFRLATLVAMIGGDQAMRDDMKDQLTEWRRLKILSEMTEPIRALYELLAGHTCVCEGNKGMLEDQARTFVLSDRFGLDWRQSFGLRLWYAIREEEPLESAVRQYRQDLDTQHEERARPKPWFQEQDVSILWKDPDADHREDLLWGLLQHFSDRVTKESHYPLAAILLPHNHQLSPLDFRLAWQLQQTLSLRRPGNFGAAASPSAEQDDDFAARLTTDYAWQLESAGHWQTAIYVVAHLSHAPQRKLTIQAILARNARAIGAGGLADDTWRRLVKEYLVPEPWLWEAKALYARSVTLDRTAEVDFLLKAGNWREAHTTLCAAVAPRAVIEGDTTTLKELLGGFKTTHLIPGWELGGQVYADYLRLLALSEQGDAAHGGEAAGPVASAKEKSMAQVVASLSASLPAMVGGGRGEKADFMERVAVGEMSGVLGKVMLRRRGHDQSIESSKVLALPLMEDRCLKHTVDLALGYYRAVMAGGAQP